MSRSRALASSLPRRLRAAGFAMITSSLPASSCALLLRNHSRIPRLTRFRTTALPTFLLTVIPSRQPVSPRAIKMTKQFEETRRPWRPISRYSLETRIRSARPKRPVPVSTSTWTESRLRDAFGSLSAGASGLLAPHGSSCERENHGRACGEFGWADRSASSRTAFRASKRTSRAIELRSVSPS